MHKHPPHHGQHLAPHHHQPNTVTGKILELMGMKSPNADLHAILASLAAQHGVEPTSDDAVLDIAAAIDMAIANCRTISLAKLVTAANDGNVLGAGQIPPHVIDMFMKSNIRFTQIHEAHGHNDMTPPHVTHFQRKYPQQFGFAMTIDQVVGYKFNVVVVHAYEHAGELFVPRLAAVATQLWATAPLVAIRAHHQAPHHCIGLGDRQPAFFIEE